MLDATAHFRLPLVALATSVLALSGCHKAAETPPAPPPKPQAEAPKPPPPPPPALDRAGLLQGMEDAAAAYSGGDDKAADDLAGRRFVIRQAFGCFDRPQKTDAPAAEGLAQLNWQDDRNAVELSLTPGDWKDSSLVAGGAADWEAVEGFWLVRPWLRTEACPGVQPDPLASGPPLPSPQTMGLAAVFETGGSRLGRRNGRAYSFVLRGKDGKPPALPTGGFRLVLEGRLTSFADGRAIHCLAASPDQRPVCIAAARLDRVAFEDAEGAVLSDWRTG
jgi:hypothetical protein